MIYPPKIAAIIAGLSHVGDTETNAAGSDANFSCGSFVRFRLWIDRKEMIVRDAGFSSNGCGYMLAAAETLAGYVSGKRLADLHGLDESKLRAQTGAALGDLDRDRLDCVSSAIDALRNAFADFRSRQIEEFRGEAALVCTCFGVTEETVETAMRDQRLATVDEVAAVCNAGSGCGSCRMLIQEIIDGAAREAG